MTLLQFYERDILKIVSMKRNKKEIINNGDRLEDKRFSLHSWSTEDLNQLRDIQNHRIIHNKFNYVWDCFLNGEWAKRSIQQYDDIKTPYTHLYFWLGIWNKEYIRRIQHVEKKRLKNETARWTEAVSVVHRNHIKKSERVKRIKLLLPNITKKDIAELTEMSYKQVKRILKDE
tara:strand:- start:410 stop:931 length:522 start_codon:yes stop_codon:yes gene_type:complete